MKKKKKNEILRDENTKIMMTMALELNTQEATIPNVYRVFLTKFRAFC